MSTINVLCVQFDLDVLSRFRATWKDGPRTASKKLERLRAFFRFAHDRQWIETNPATRIKLPKVFAVELLLAGVPIERVSVLLGHQSVRVTEKHYNPWVRSRQEQEADVVSAWTRDPLLSQKAIGTNSVHSRKEQIN